MFACCPIICLYVPSSVLRCLLQFPHKNDVRFVFTSSCLQEGLCLIYFICVCLRIHVVVSNTYCAVFLFCQSSSILPDCSFLIAPSVISNVYLHTYLSNNSPPFTNSSTRYMCCGVSQISFNRIYNINNRTTKTLPTIWGTYMKLVTKYQIYAINSC